MAVSQFQKPVRSLRLPAEEVELIVHRVSHVAAAATQGAERRAADRHHFRSHNVVIEVTQPAGSTMCFLVETYSLSSGGLGFVHGGFLHIGSSCMVRLPTCDNAWVDLKGKIVRCRHLERGVHDVGVNWVGLTEPLDMALFLGSNTPRSRVLLIEDSDLTRKLAAHFLQRLNIDLVQAATLAEARKLIDEQSWDVALIDLNLPDGDGRELVKEWRPKSPSTYMIAFTVTTAAEQREAIMAHGFDAFLEKPFTAEQIAKSLQDAIVEPITSSLGVDEESMALIADYVKNLPGELFRLSAALDICDWTQAREQIRQLGSNGKGYGFTPVAEACGTVEEALKAEPVDPDAVRQRFHQLVRIGRRCRAS